MDVFLLMAFLYVLDKGNNKRVVKIERNKFINIRKTLEYFRNNAAAKLP